MTQGVDQITEEERRRRRALYGLEEPIVPTPAPTSEPTIEERRARYGLELQPQDPTVPSTAAPVNQITEEERKRRRTAYGLEPIIEEEQPPTETPSETPLSVEERRARYNAVLGQEEQAPAPPPQAPPRLSAKAAAFIARQGAAPEGLGIPAFMPGVEPKPQIRDVRADSSPGRFISAAIAPLDVQAETIAESLAQVPKIFTGRFGDVEAPTLFREGFDESLASFRGRTGSFDIPFTNVTIPAEQIGVGMLDPFSVAAGTGLVRGLTSGAIRAGIRAGVQQIPRAPRPGLRQAAQQAGVTRPVQSPLTPPAPSRTVEQVRADLKRVEKSIYYYERELMRTRPPEVYDAQGISYPPSFARRWARYRERNAQVGELYKELEALQRGVEQQSGQLPQLTISGSGIRTRPHGPSVQRILDMPPRTRLLTQTALPPGTGRTAEGSIVATGRVSPGFVETERVLEPITTTQIERPGVRGLRGDIPFEAATPEEATRLREQVRELTGRRTAMEPPEVVTTRPQAQQQIAQEFYDAVPDSATDIAATSYLRSGKIVDYIRRIPRIFEVAKGFADETFREVGRVSAKMADPTRTIQAIDFGYFGGALQRGLLWPTRRTMLASVRWGDDTKTSYRQMLAGHGIRSLNPVRTRQKLDAAGDVLEEIGTNELNVSDDVLASQVEHLLKKFTPTERLQIVRVAKDTRLFFDNLLRVQNAARARRGQSAIPRLQNYRPWIRNTNIWSRIGMSDAPARSISDSPLPPDFIKPNAPFNPRALRRNRGLEGYEKIRNIERLAFDYVETARKDIFYTNIIQNGKAHIKALRGMDLENAAASIEDWIMESYAGKLPGLSKGIRENVPSPIVKGALALRRSLTRSVFPLNWTWNAFVQTSSASLTVKNYGVVSTLQGLEFLVNPSVRNAVQKNAYSAIIKRRGGGRAVLQDVGPGIGSTSKVQRSAVETAEGFANLLTNLIEDNLTGISVRAAYHDGVRRGLKGRALWEYASEGGSKTQSMYNLEDLPGVLRTREVGAIVPFQTFAFEIMNTVREAGIGIGGIGARTQQNRLVGLAHWTAMMFAFNTVGETVNNRQPWQLSSFVPFWSLMVMGTDPGNTWNMPLPAKYIADFKKGVEDVVQHGSWTRLRTWGIRYHMIGGTQIDRTVKGIEAVADEEVTDVSGRRMFRVSPDEWKKAVAQGPYSTSEGREYIDKLNENKGPIYKYTGIPFR